jgi:trigger factor
LTTKVEKRTEPGSRVVLEIDVPEDDVARAMDQAYASLVKRVQVPGFRKGKAPRAILERHVGPEVLREEAIRRLASEQYAEAVTQTGIDPISRPSIETKEGPGGKGLRLIATVDVYPTFQVPDYRAIHVARERLAVTDEDVDKALEDLRTRHGRLQSAADEPARRGDFVLLTVASLSAPAAGAPGLERLQPGRELLVEVGGGLLPAPVEAALEGARPGDDRTAVVGDGVEVTVHVADVRRKELPALDDAFARTVSDQETLAELREGLRSRMAAEQAREDARRLRERVVDAVLAQTQMDLPESLVQHEIQHIRADLEDQLRSRGLSLESYLRSQNKDDAALRQDLRPGAERRVRSRLLLEAVAAREKLTVTEEEMRAEVEKLAADLNQDAAKVQAWLAEGSRREGLRETILRRKAMTLLVELVAGAPEAASSGAAATDPATETPGEPGSPA